MRFVGHALDPDAVTMADVLTTRLIACLRGTGPSFADLGPREGGGTAVWGPERLLEDLELRLGMAGERASPPARARSLSARMAAAPDRFYARSHRRDPLGTAAMLLEWRDELVLAGWNGEAIPGGGARLAAFAELEAMSAPSVAPGLADRVRTVERAIGQSRGAWFDCLLLAEDRARWPLRWRRIFAALERQGCRVEPLTCAPVDDDDSDLGALRLGLGRGAPITMCGDGSFLVLRAETVGEAAAGAAALLGRWGDDSVILRGGPGIELDAALVARGLPATGSWSASHFRPPLQILPLAVELAFAPRDPHRVLDLLTSSAGPFRPFTRRLLARALSSSPGIGGRSWTRAKDRIAEMSGAGEVELVETWLEGPTHDPFEGAPREALAAVGRRVVDWARRRVAGTSGDRVAGVALAQAEELVAAALADPRPHIDLVAARQLAEEVVRALPIACHPAGAGCIDAVDHPGLLLSTWTNVVWWHLGGLEPLAEPRSRWRAAEREALAAAGVELCDPARELAATVEEWRRPIQRASERLLLVMPATSGGRAFEPHPVWSDIQARVAPAGLATVTIAARDLLRGTSGIDLALDVEALPPLELPAPRPSWALPVGLVAGGRPLSATALERLLGCPLRFVLEEVAGIRPERISAIPPSFLLAGSLGHRLVEELVREGAMLAGEAALRRRTGELFDELVPGEASALLLAGASFETRQVRRQLVDAIVALGQALAARGLAIDGVEIPVAGAWGEHSLSGRIDLLARGRAGEEVILDLKWGRSRYRDLLSAGLAVQLAIYAFLRRAAGAAASSAAYFSLSRGEIIATGELALPGEPAVAGPAADEVWLRVERTALSILAELAAGSIPATGVLGSVPLDELLAGDDLLSAPPGAGCEHCQLDPLCGRRWEALS